MNIIAIDDERLALNSIVEVLEKVFPNDNIKGFQSQSRLTEYASQQKEEGNVIDYAFLDIQIYGENGLILAKELKEMFPDLKIIFCTAYREYAVDAWMLHAIGYLLKPVTEEAVRETLNEMDRGGREENKMEKSESRPLEILRFL